MSNTTQTTSRIIELKIFDRADCGPRHGSRKAIIVSLTETLTGATGTKATGMLPCDDWDQADYRMPIRFHDVACNIKVTGRTVQYNGVCAWVRIAVTFIGDGEANSVVRGWGRVS